MKRVLTMISLAVITASSHATITNGSFERGLAGWQAIGGRAEAGYLTKGTATDGLTSVALDALDIFPSLATRASISSFLNIAPGTLSGFSGSIGAAIKQTFIGHAGDVLSFDYSFGLETQKGKTGESAFYTINGMPFQILDVSDGSKFHEFDIRDYPQITQLSGEYSGLLGHRYITDINKISIPILTNGLYTIGFAELTAGNGMSDATLFIDNVRLAEVPEPASLALFGIAGAALLARRRKS